MKCPNCGAETFEGDKFCGECGYDLTKNEHDPTAQTASKNENINDIDREGPESRTQSAKDHQGTDNRNGGEAKAYFSEILTFYKDSIFSPARVIGSGYFHNISVTAGTIGLLILITSLITFIQMRSTMGGSFITFSTVFEILITMIIMVGVFFGITYALLAIVIRQNKHWHRVFNDFAVPVVIVFSLFIMAALLSLITLYEIGFLFSLIGFLLFISAPIYILLRYAENNNVKFDSFYAMIIYYVLVAIVFYIIGRLLLVSFISNFLYELENMMMF